MLQFQSHMLRRQQETAERLEARVEDRKEKFQQVSVSHDMMQSLLSSSGAIEAYKQFAKAPQSMDQQHQEMAQEIELHRK